MAPRPTTIVSNVLLIEPISGLAIGCSKRLPRGRSTKKRRRWRLMLLCHRQVEVVTSQFAVLLNGFVYFIDRAEIPRERAHNWQHWQLQPDNIPSIDGGIT